MDVQECEDVVQLVPAMIDAVLRLPLTLLRKEFIKDLTYLIFCDKCLWL